MRNALAAASALVLLVSGIAQASPREELDLSMRVTGRTGAHDVVEAAGVGLTVALLAHQRQPRVLRAERVTLEGEPLWRVDVAGQDADGYGCSAIAAWISEAGAVIRLAKVSESGPLDDCSQWYFDGDSLAIEAARDLARDGWTDEPEAQYRTEEPWSVMPEGWDAWIRESQVDPCEGVGDCSDGW
jgi:hypothetical protein